MTGKTLQPGQIEQLLINAFAYREYLIRAQINDAANLNLVAFSRAPFLDRLGELVGVRRLSSSRAMCPIKLTLIPEHGNLTIPEGTRVQSIDGVAVFSLMEDIHVLPDQDEVIANFVCVTPGELGNNYSVGSVAVIIDPQPYLLSAENTQKTAGGANDENDEGLRERIMLAPQSFSNAGSRGAYRFHALSAVTGIGDIKVTSPIPGQVNIYALMQGGELPNQAVLDEILNICNDDKIRPLTDTVIVGAPTVVAYSIAVEMTLITGSIAIDATNKAVKGLQEYATQRKNKIGLDVVKERIISVCMADPAIYDVIVISPAETLVVDDNQVAICDSVAVTVIGYSDE